jgi:hypothetical protein
MKIAITQQIYKTKGRQSENECRKYGQGGGGDRGDQKEVEVSRMSRNSLTCKSYIRGIVPKCTRRVKIKMN